jgi:hypothetical protein
MSFETGPVTDVDEQPMRCRRATSELQTVRAARTESPSTIRAISEPRRLTTPKSQLAIGRHGIAEYHMKAPRILDRRYPRFRTYLGKYGLLGYGDSEYRPVTEP